MAEIKLTRSVRKKLAKAAREEAYEIAERGAPGTLYPYNWCGCGIGHVIRRAGVASFGPSYKDRSAAQSLAERIDALLTDEASGSSSLGLGIVSDAAVEEKKKRNGALVFPLLALAAALDETEGD